ncbi:MAG: nicotinate (nicotinamide) nucleotide adenylyltransferase [Ruminococcaceae bacterium]|nr:nicotinate (nicotinamide) nucleotide adenylyltransferase [Oscillospiraceae bacterium]
MTERTEIRSAPGSDGTRLPRLGIFGGTFAPPHMGHVRAAEAFLRMLNPPGTEEEERAKLLIIPTATSPHKAMAEGDTPEARLRMCRAAFGHLPDTEVSDYEIAKGGVSYTVLTLEHFAGACRELWLLCGSDMFLTLGNWYRAADIFRLARIAGISRGTEEKRILEAKRTEYEERFGVSVALLEDEPFPLSSTEIRRRIAEDGDLDGLLPPGVTEIIRRDHLYEYGMNHGETNA